MSYEKLLRERVAALTAQVAALTTENAGIRQAAIAAWDEQEATMKALRANLLEVTAANERLTGLLDSPGSIATPWPTRSVLTRLADAADHLLRDHNCDHHGYECLNQAVAIARAALPSSRETTDGAN